MPIAFNAETCLYKLLFIFLWTINGPLTNCKKNIHMLCMYIDKTLSICTIFQDVSVCMYICMNSRKTYLYCMYISFLQPKFDVCPSLSKSVYIKVYVSVVLYMSMYSVYKYVSTYVCTYILGGW